jgi:hypothetical protein
VRSVLLVFPAILLLSVGCRGEQARYVPAEEKAREALKAALTAWQNGEPKTGVKADGLSVNVNDAKWKQGAKLRSFEIVRMEPPVEAAQHPFVFLVRLEFEKSPERQEFRYIVFGKDPLWVCDEADYKRMEG